MGTTAVAAPQHMRALEQANQVRLARAELKRRIAAEEVSVADVILSRPSHTEGMEVSELLTSQRQWGRARCRRLLVSLGVPENKLLGTLTDRQRTRLAEGLALRPNGRAHVPSPEANGRR
jgi:hypothetical protein